MMASSLVVIGKGKVKEKKKEERRT